MELQYLLSFILLLAVSGLAHPSQPGLGFQPMPPESHVDSTIIWYKKIDPANLEVWTKKIDDFLHPYKNMTTGGHIINCNYDTRPTDNKVCFVDVTRLVPCGSINSYNYHTGNPCIFLKLDKIYNWIPDYYKQDEKLPETMPTDLQDYIKALNNPLKTEMVWVSCEGENPADIENIGPIQYFPEKGFPGYFFPYKNQEGYLSPVIAVWFERPKAGVLINIECKAWAKNIIHDRVERRGSVHFELMID